MCGESRKHCVGRSKSLGIVRNSGAVNVPNSAATASVTAGTTAGGDALVNIAEKTAGFSVVARSTSGGGKLYLVPSGTPANITAIGAAKIAEAIVTQGNVDRTIAVSTANAGVTNGTSYVVYAVTENGIISAPTGTAFTADLVAPVISVISNGGTYANGTAATFSEGTALLNGGNYNSGTAIGQGAHTLSLTDAAGNTTTITFTINP